VDAAKYHRLNKSGEGYIDLQVQKKWKKICIHIVDNVLPSFWVGRQ
jgi:hypothetical protein